MKPSFLLNETLSIRPLTFKTEALHLVATVCYVVNMPPSVSSMVSPLYSVAGIHDVLC